MDTQLSHQADIGQSVHFLPSGHRFHVRDNETVFEAATRQGYQVAHACKNGVCHICQAVMLQGRVEANNLPLIGDAKSVSKGESGNDYPNASNHQPMVLLCKARPLAACEFEFESIRGPNELNAKNYAMQVVSVEIISGHVYAVNLLAPAGSIPEYFAGQYLQLIIPGQEAAFYSIANAPGQREIQLHIEVHPAHASAVAVLDYLQNNPVVTANLPKGNCFMADLPSTDEDSTSDVILISAGTGFSQVKAIAEFMLNQQYPGAVTIYWGVRDEREMYGRNIVEQWCRDNSRWQFVPVFADSPDHEWQGHHDELVKAVIAGDHEWRKAQVYISGSPTMVYTALDGMKPKGVREDRCFSDVFEYAPR